MTDVQVQDRDVSDSGQYPRGVTNPPSTAKPITGAETRSRSTHRWSVRSAAAKTIGLLAVVVLAFLALNFVFHATGAVNVGFAGLTFSVGSFLASPFVGIFKTTSAGQGNLLVWTDVLAMAVYTAVAIVIVTVVARVTGGVTKRSA